MYVILPAGFAYTPALARVLTGSVWPVIAVHGGMHMTNVVPQFMAEEYTIWAVVGEGILWICVGAAIHYRYRNSLRWN